MIAWLIIYIIGVLLVGGVAVWFMKETDEDITLLDLMRMLLLTLLSWGSVLLFILFVICDKIEDVFGKVIIKKGVKEDEE